MKLYKYLSLALLATLASCSEAGPDPEAIDPGSFFPSYSSTAYQKCAKNEEAGDFDNTFNVQICRTGNAVGQQVRLSYSVKVYDPETDSYVPGSNNLFTVPEVFTYTTNEPMGYIPVVAHNQLIELGETVLLTMNILDDTTYGASTIEIEYTHVTPEESFSPGGTCNMVDGWVMPLFGLDPFDYSFDCSYEVNDADPLLFRLVNPYQSSMYFAGLRSYNIAPVGGRYYILIDLNSFEHPAILPSLAGFEMSPAIAPWGNFTIGNFEGYCLDSGIDYADMDSQIAPEDRSELTRNEYNDYVINVPNCLFWIEAQAAPVAQGGKGQITFPVSANIKNETSAPAKSARKSEAQINRELAVKKLDKILNIKF